MERDEFVERFGPIFQGEPWIADEAWERRPFAGLYDLRLAFQSAMFDAPPERQLELIRSYPDLAGRTTADRPLAPESRRDQAFAGLHRLSEDEYDIFGRLNAQYRQRFDFPFVICVRDHTKETILTNLEARLGNPPAQERATALVEIAKIANLRLLDLVEDPKADQGTVAERA